MRWYLAILLMFISSGSFAAPPSFCTVEHSAVSRLICADEELWTADAEVFGEFNAWQSNVEGADREIRNQSHGDDWIRARNEQCRLYGINPDTPLETLMAAKPCLLKLYKERKDFYDSVMWN